MKTDCERTMALLAVERWVSWDRTVGGQPSRRSLALMGPVEWRWWVGSNERWEIGTGLGGQGKDLILGEGLQRGLEFRPWFEYTCPNSRVWSLKCFFFLSFYLFI